MIKLYHRIDLREDIFTLSLLPFHVDRKSQSETDRYSGLCIQRAPGSFHAKLGRVRHNSNVNHANTLPYS